MLGCRLVIDWQMRGRTDDDDELELDTPEPEMVTGARRKTTRLGTQSTLEAKKRN